MNIIKSNPETLTGKDVYQMVKSPTIGRMRDCAGQTLELDAFLFYEDVDSNDEIQTIVSIRTKDGDVYATNSPTFARDFDAMLECFASTGEQVHAIKVISSTSKNGRAFITCDYAN